ncbi:hypothetical protein TOPH_02518 [Tolypocladium ophioglossoides CBS 100239]|uniref:Uncharacterized protein n=1 Tax=Tolypocladium ophioglossoides (strain CBS 100239) TaxID=1163406 RepID=A0A0L0NFD9_TOLOC|nr:hypothetical protein TOPH_02518 [Tolypocladium ophioglossoides CBS 100239]
MANPPPRAKDPLDALQLLVNDVRTPAAHLLFHADLLPLSRAMQLVQTGKALRASRRDSHGNVAPAHGSLQAKLPDTIKQFHAALGDLESDIIRAKSVLLRDLNELQAQRKPAEQLQPHPVEPQSKSPMTIDLDSSPPPAPKDRPIKTEPAAKPVAPFPDMGMSLPEPTQSVTVIKEEEAPAQAPSAAALGAQVKAEMPTGELKLAVGQPNAVGADDTLGMNSELNFTDMEFTLAPANNESHEHLGGDAVNSSANEPSFDLTSFAAPADGADGSSNTMASLDTILPANLAAPTGALTSTDNLAKTEVEKSSELPDSAFADVFTGDGQADGMDFDFSISGVGMGGDTFDDLMNDRDNTYDTMEHGDFDTTYFGLDKTDDS